MPSARISLLAVALTASMVTPAASADYHRGDRITGSVSQVIDGDTLRFRQGNDSVDVRFHGIDAPEHDQTCQDAQGVSYACGRSATDHLAELIGAALEPCRSSRMHGVCVRTSRPVVCDVTDIDRRYHRPVARCTSGGTELNREMVADGWARAYTAYSQDYVAVEAIARGQRRGQWAGTSQNPAEYRRR